MEIRYLEWDSEFFGKSVYLYRYDPAVNNLEELKTFVKENAADLVYIFTDPSTVRPDEIESIGARLYDRKVTFAAFIEDVEEDDIEEITSYEGPPSGDMLELGIRAGAYSRFLADEKLNSKFIDLYTKWVVNSVNGTLADKVYVANTAARITAMVTCKVKNEIGNIGLIAVADGQQGNGWGSKLVRKVHGYYRSKGVRKATVVTQLDNTQACKFYSKMGYQVDSIENIYHLWSDQVL